MIKSVHLLALLTIMGGTAARAQEMPPLVDGAAWKVKAPNGMTVEMTFTPDGVGVVKAGLFSGQLSWSIHDGAFCLDGIPEGVVCMALSVVGNDVVGTTSDGKQMIFERS